MTGFLESYDYMGELIVCVVHLWNRFENRNLDYTQRFPVARLLVWGDNNYGCLGLLASYEAARFHLSIVEFPMRSLSFPSYFLPSADELCYLSLQ